MASPMLSAGLITAQTLQISSAQAGAIQATNLSFDNLSVSGNLETIINETLNGVTSSVGSVATVKGSRKIANSPFHLPTPRGKYAVDMHNVVHWYQAESCVAIKKSLSPQYLNDAYESTGRTLEYVSDTVIPDGSGYTVPTKYGNKRLDLSYGDCFYDHVRQVFVTPPQPLHMTLFVPSMRDKTEEFNFFVENNQENYYQLECSGDIENEFMVNAGTAFYDDVADDSVFNMLLTYDFSDFDETDVPLDINGEIMYPNVLENIQSSQLIATESDNNRYTFIKNVFRYFRFNVNMSNRVKGLFEAIKTTGGFQRMMSYKWNVKRYTTYTTNDGIISTDISQTTLPNETLPVHLTQCASYNALVDIASRGVVGILISYDYNFGYHRVPNANNNKLMEGALVMSSYLINAINDSTSRIPENCLFPYESMNVYTTTDKLIDNGVFTSLSSIDYNIEFLRYLSTFLVSFEFIDLSSVSTQGYSASAIWPICSNIITETISTFPMTFKCGVIVDTFTGLPWNDIDASGNKYGDYLGTPSRKLLPNGYSLPVLWMDQVHGSFGKNDPTNVHAGSMGFLQSQFRKTEVGVRSECIYHENGDVHIYNYQSNVYTNSEDRLVYSYKTYIRSDGMDYPDDSFNNLVFNESIVSLESDLIMQSTRANTGISMIICRHVLPDFPISKEMIKAVLPGTTTISPYTLDDSAEYIDNATIYDSIKLPKVITAYDLSVYDFSHSMPGKSTYCFDLSKITSTNLSFNLQNLPTDEIYSITITSRKVIYDSSSHDIQTYEGMYDYYTYIPHADSSGFADTSGIDFVRGEAPSGSWKVSELDGDLCFISGDVGESGTPDNNGSVIMNVVIPEGINGYLNFTGISSSEGGYDFLYVYKNDILFDSSLSGDNNSKNYSLSVTSGDTIKIAYIKDFGYTYYNDVIYIKNMVLQNTSFSTLSVPEETKPTCDVLVVLADESSTTTPIIIPDSKLTPEVITLNYKEVSTIKIIPKDNLCISGKLLITVEYTKIPLADSMIKYNY